MYIPFIHLYICIYLHRHRLWGQPGHAPPITKTGQNPFFAPNNQTRIFYETKKEKYKEKEVNLNEGCKFLKKVVDD